MSNTTIADAENDSEVIDEIRILVGKVLSMLASGLHHQAVVYASEAAVVAKELRTEAAQESVWETFMKLDALLVASGAIEPREEDEIVCTMPWAEA